MPPLAAIMRTLQLFLTLIIFGSCINNPKTINSSQEILDKDSLLWKTTRTRNYPFPVISDSTNSFIQLLHDTCRIYLSTGWFEGSYSINVDIFNDSPHNTSFRLFENYTNYKYARGIFSISFDKKKFKAGEYVMANVKYETIGEPLQKYQIYSDTVKMSGKLRLKVRDSSFTFETLMNENFKNDFYAETKRRPDTIKKLFLYNSKWLTEIPKEILLYTNLEELHLEGTDLSKADLGLLCNFRHLKILDLGECNLSEIPTCFNSLKELEELDLNLNNLTFLPECTYELTNLKDLDIESNKILSLSPNIKKLKNLESIGLAKTNILYLPDEMISLRKLKEIYANDTMKYVPKTLLKYMQNDYYIKK